jgi:hypothetical protein
MLGDLEDYKKVADSAKATATYYSPFTPTHQMSNLKDLALIGDKRHDIIDLNSVMKNTASNFEKLNDDLKRHKIEIKDYE